MCKSSTSPERKLQMLMLSSARSIDTRDYTQDLSNLTPHKNYCGLPYQFHGDVRYLQGGSLGPHLLESVHTPLPAKAKL